MSATRLTSALFIATFIAGCVDEDVGRDRDNDGFQTWELGGEDCDDTNANVNPSQSELCGNGIDDDCDGFIDNEGVGETDWYLDEDADGFTQPDPVISCARPDGALADASSRIDCDDTSDAIYPGAPEVWYDGIDQACDGGNDFDADGDGYNGIDGGGDDCDDSEVGVNPGSVELCGNGLDDDCDGTPNQCEWRGEVVVEDIATAMFPVESERQWYRDLTGDGVEDVLLVTFPNRDGEREWSLYAGPFEPGGVSVPLTAWVTVNEAGNDDLHQAILEPDLNGDGIADLVVPRARVDRLQPGFEVFLSPHQGRTLGTADLSIPTLADEQPAIPVVVGAIDDLDGDGADELLWAATSELSPTPAHTLQITLASELTSTQSTGVAQASIDWKASYFPKRVSIGSSFPLVGIEPDTDEDGVTRASDDTSNRYTVQLSSQPDPVFVSVQLNLEDSQQGAVDTARNRTSSSWDLDSDGTPDSFLPALAVGRWSTPSEQFAGLALVESGIVPMLPTQTQVAGEGVVGEPWQWTSTVCQWIPEGPPEVIEFGEILDRLPLVLGDSVLSVSVRLSVADIPEVIATVVGADTASCADGRDAIFITTSDAQTALLIPERQ